MIIFFDVRKSVDVVLRPPPSGKSTTPQPLKDPRRHLGKIALRPRIIYPILTFLKKSADRRQAQAAKKLYRITEQTSPTVMLKSPSCVNGSKNPAPASAPPPNP